jgi:hypothetical protein|tara:strand:- start:260 stop:376 length:117 start_codon:yes stop_codon:yes gene_type:complete
MKDENLKKESKSSWGGRRLGLGRKPRLQFSEILNLSTD